MMTYFRQSLKLAPTRNIFIYKQPKRDDGNESMSRLIYAPKNCRQTIHHNRAECRPQHNFKSKEYNNHLSVGPSNSSLAECINVQN